MRILDWREREISNRELPANILLGLSGALAFPTILKDCRVLPTNAL
jgi:hypothetical protein